MMQQFHLLIHGDVQGVGYRSWMKREAKALQLVGWVKNRKDRVVEAVVQGEGKAVEQLIARSKIGPEVAWVESVEMREQPVDAGLFTFEVIY